MRKTIILSSAALLALLVIASADLIAQRQGGPRPGSGRGGQAVEAGGEQGPQDAGPGRFRPGRRGGQPGFAGLGRNLDLTDEQRTKVQELMLSSRDKAGPIADELRLAENTLRRELFADTRDEATVNELAGKVAELQKQVADVRFETTASIAGLLTPEQKQKVRAGAGGLGWGPAGGPGRGPGPAFRRR